MRMSSPRVQHTHVVEDSPRRRELALHMLGTVLRGSLAWSHFVPYAVPAAVATPDCQDALRRVASTRSGRLHAFISGLLRSMCRRRISSTLSSVSCLAGEAVQAC